MTTETTTPPVSAPRLRIQVSHGALPADLEDYGARPLNTREGVIVILSGERGDPPVSHVALLPERMSHHPGMRLIDLRGRALCEGDLTTPFLHARNGFDVLQIHELGDGRNVMAVALAALDSAHSYAQAWAGEATDAANIYAGVAAGLRRDVAARPTTLDATLDVLERHCGYDYRAELRTIPLEE